MGVLLLAVCTAQAIKSEAQAPHLYNGTNVPV